MNEIRTIMAAEADAVFSLVQETIQKIYPRFYSPDEVLFFRQLHNKEAIARDILAGAVYGLFWRNRLVGTGTCQGRHIARLFIAPDLQGQGIGSKLLEYLEGEIARTEDCALLDASKPAELFYRGRGYQIVRQEQWPLESGDALVWNVMEKKLGQSSWNR